MNRMMNTRMAILPSTAPANGSRNLLAMPSVSAPTSVPHRFPTPPNTTIFLRHTLSERQLFLRSRLELRRAVHSEDHVKEFLTHYTRKGSQHAQRDRKSVV